VIAHLTQDYRSDEIPSGVRNIVIVHGAWLMIKLVQSDSIASSKGLHVVAVQNPLTSLA